MSPRSLRNHIKDILAFICGRHRSAPNRL
jgi:hypothetical protein